MTIGTKNDRPLRGMGVGSLTAPPPITAPSQRRCAREGCITVLSVYNPRTCCWLHEPPHRATLFPGGRRPNQRYPAA